MKVDVIKYQRLWWSFSAIAFLASVAAIAISINTFNAPLRPGLDFTGGTKLQLELDCSIPNNCDRPISVTAVNQVLDSEDLPNSDVQIVEDYTLSVRTKNIDVEARSKLRAALSEKIGTFDPKKIQIDSVGPSIGRQLFISGLLALLASFTGIVGYLSFRFQFDYALFAIVALLHDVSITAGIFSVLGLVAGVEVDSLFLVSLLTIIGFSVNDTVVIYDRIRETAKENPDRPMTDVVDEAVNKTLGRSINTTLTTLLPLVAIFIFGGASLKFFALALIVGFALGSYSSIFLASTLLAWWKELRKPASVNIPVPTPSIDDGQ